MRLTELRAQRVNILDIRREINIKFVIFEIQTVVRKTLNIVYKPFTAS